MILHSSLERKETLYEPAGMSSIVYSPSSSPLIVYSPPDPVSLHSRVPPPVGLAQTSAPWMPTCVLALVTVPEIPVGGMMALAAAGSSMAQRPSTPVTVTARTSALTRAPLGRSTPDPASSGSVGFLSPLDTCGAQEPVM